MTLAIALIALAGVGIAIQTFNSCDGEDGSICKDGWLSKRSPHERSDMRGAIRVPLSRISLRSCGLLAFP